MAAEKKATILSLQRTLSAIQQRASKIMIFVTAFKDEDDPLMLETRGTVLDEMRITYFETESKLYGLVKDDEVPIIEKESEEFFDLLSEIRYQIMKKVKALSKPPEAMTSDTSFAQKPNPDSCIKLPEISLPKFNGHYEQWLYFRSQFKLLVRRNDSLNDQQRLHYLRSCLSGEAATIETPEESFASLWMALEARYENRRWLVDRHLADIFQLKQIQVESSSALRELINIVQKNLRALSSLKLPLDALSECMVVHVVASRLDKQTHKDFESHVVGTKLVKWQGMVDFLQNRCRILENLEQDHKLASHSNTKPSANKWKPNVLVSSNRDSDYRSKFACFNCKGGHYINECRNFLSKSPTQRFQRVKELKLCVNCFSNRHIVAECKSGTCKECDLRHNTLLHFETKSTDANTDTKSNPVRVELCTMLQPVQSCEQFNSALMNTHGPEAYCFPSESTVSKKVQLMAVNDQALLHTALVQVRSSSGELQECRAVLDSCAMSTFMTTACAKRLRLKTFSSNVSVVGFGRAGRQITESVVAHVSSRSSYFESMAEFLVTPRLTNKLPLRSFDIANWNIPDWIDLADPQFNKTAKIDILFGIVEWDKMMLFKSYTLSKELPTFRQTVFGWVAGGHVKERDSYPQVQVLSVTNEQLDKQVSKFWCIENYGSENSWSVEEQAAEDHFVSNHSRDVTGRYTVALPFRNMEIDLGDSRHMAHRRFLLLEARLTKDQKLYADYKQFMQEFIDLGHMEQIGTFNPVELQSEKQYFLPHHAVKRPDSSTTKLRVVFDASAKTSNGKSLNDQLMVGPTLQPQLVDTLLRFRTYKVAVTSDVSKMFRQILVRKEDRRFQQILWRSSTKDEIGVYQLTTVTYGTASAPFLAVRTLMQICEDEAEQYPLAAEVGKKSVCVDDVLFGADTVEEARELKGQLAAMLEKAGFELHKWCSNSKEVLADIPEARLEQKVLLNKEGRTKTLGLTWQPDEDVFSFEVMSIAFDEGVPTKRTILSDISKLFDPLGLAGPVIMTGKLIMQELWKEKLNWDEPLEAGIENRWNEYRLQLQTMNTIRISRCVLPLLQTEFVELAGFCDASQKGYGACLYLRSRNSQGQISSRLLCSKSRVAPIKGNRTTIPRLELCGARLLAQLANNVRRSLPVTVNRVRFWSDSTIALSWINTCPSKLDVFVSNRVAAIQQLSDPSEWCHVSTHDNPADLVSRGIMPQELHSSKLWWCGPPFLRKNDIVWPKGVQLVDPMQLPELIQVTAMPAVVERLHLFDNCSKYNIMLRVVARIKRMFQNRQRSAENQRRGEFSAEEMRYAKLTIVRLVQKESFPEVFAQLREEVTSKNHSLIPLSPFVDNHGLLRVGGRLSKSACSYDTKHQMILPKNHPVTGAIIRSFHESNMHAGIQVTLAATRREFWIIRGRSVVKQVIKSCVVCFKSNPRPIQQYMGDLPACRVEGQYPFYRVGIDLCGPVFLKQRNKRSTVEYKGWIVLYICLATKAIHLELVSELSTAAFLASFDRFVSRRGRPIAVWTDNGTNFVGAANLLKEWEKFFKSFDNQDDILRAYGNSVEWHFNPPEAPHFGGIWESNIRQTKVLLLKHTAAAALSFEEFSTVLCRIEAVLNSRPLTPLSDDPEDFEALTPGHFLVFRSLNAVARPVVIDQRKHPRQRNEHITAIIQHFWNRWQSEYLSSLQVRYKWHKKVEVEVGQLVLIKKDNMPVQKWLLGRIIEVIPGTEGVVRVVDVKTENGILRRPVSKLCFLPIDPEQSFERDTFQRREDVQNNLIESASLQ